tara:strand:+ start:3441 stop:3644 length:204 start_codon:yes stop_codon:yes gene_type:complete
LVRSICDPFLKQALSTNQSFSFFPMTFVDPRYEDEAIAALMEEALTEDSEETKFDVEKYIENSNFDW